MPEEQVPTESIKEKYSSCRCDESETLTLGRNSQGQHRSMPEDLLLINRSIKTFPTGSTYAGTWNPIGMSGEGTFTFADKGVVYKGGFDDGVFHGDGTLYYEESGAVLKGKWNKGKLTERHLFFADDLEYVEDDWAYCRPFDRRFTVEYDNGLEQAPLTYKTADQPSPLIPAGLFDTGIGLYDPDTKTVYKYNDMTSIYRTPHAREAQWLEKNCRTNPDAPKGPCPFLYEQWLTPTEKLVPEPPPVLRRQTGENKEEECQTDVVTGRPSDIKQSKLRPKPKLFTSRIGLDSKTDFYDPEFIYSKLGLGASSRMEFLQIQSKETKKDVEFLPMSGTRWSPRTSEIPKRHIQKASSVAFRAWQPESVSQTTTFKFQTQDSDLDNKLMSKWGLTSTSGQKRSDMEKDSDLGKMKKETEEFDMRNKDSSLSTSAHKVFAQDSQDYYKGSQFVETGRGQFQSDGNISTRGLISQSNQTEVVEANAEDLGAGGHISTQGLISLSEHTEIVESNAQEPAASAILSTQGLTSESEQNAEALVQYSQTKGFISESMHNIELVQDPESGDKNISIQGLSQSIHEPPVQL